MKKILKKIRKKFYLRKYKYYSKREYYHKSMSLYDNIDSFYGLFRIKNKKIVNTIQKISLNSQFEFGSNPKQILKKFGSPLCILKKNIGNLNFKVLQYKMYMGGYKAKHEIHFYHNRLFYYNYIFSYVNENEKKFIKDILCRKYLDENMFLKDILITDKEGNKIFVSDDIHFTLNYITGDESFIENIKKIRKENKQSKYKEAVKHKQELLLKL